MKFCPVVPEFPWTSSCFAERKNKNNNKKRSKNNKSPKLCLGDLIIGNGAKTISLQTLFGRLKYSQSSWTNYYYINKQSRLMQYNHLTFQIIPVPIKTSIIKWPLLMNIFRVLVF